MILVFLWDPDSYYHSSNKEVLCIPQSFRTDALPSDCLVSNPEHLLEILTPVPKM